MLVGRKLQVAVQIDPLNYWSLWVPLLLLGMIGAIALYFLSISEQR